MLECFNSIIVNVSFPVFAFDLLRKVSLCMDQCSFGCVKKLLVLLLFISQKYLSAFAQ